MKKLYLYLFTLIHITLNAQDTITIKHNNYKTTYSKSLNYPIVVEWWETTEKSSCKDKVVRSNDFKPDPNLKTYTDIGKYYIQINKFQKIKGLKTFDRGHMCPARVNLCLGKIVETESFYYSNITPQYHALNGGDWKILETFTYETSIKKDSVHIWAGSIGVSIKFLKISVPKQCWKVIHIKKTNEWSAYLFNNDTSKSNGIKDNKVNVEFIEKLTGLKFK